MDKTASVKAAIKEIQSQKVELVVAAKDTKQNKKSGSNNNKPAAVVNWWNLPIESITFSEEDPWYTLYPSYVAEEVEKSDPKTKLDNVKMSAITTAVEAAYAAEVSRFFKSQGKAGSDEKWVNDVIKSGTLSDKVAALALRVQEAPFYQLDTLDMLVAMACKKEQRTSQLALEAIKDLLTNNLLPDRKLSIFRSALLLCEGMDMQTALLLWFEDQLKTRIERVMEALENGLKSSVDYFKKLCLEMAASLLMSKPEQEARLLTMIVNKLGDPSSKTCSKCIEVLKNVISVHPVMKGVVVREVRQFIYRPNIKLKSIFNGVIYLSHVPLVKGDHAVAAQLVEAYVSLFEKAVKEDELGSRLLSALLTGINKSFPFLNNIEPISKYADSLFRLVHTSSFTSSTQALMLLSHLAVSTTEENEKMLKREEQARKKRAQDGEEHDSDEEVEDAAEKDAAAASVAATKDAGDGSKKADIMTRYYRALYAKLLSEQVSDEL